MRLDNLLLERDGAVAVLPINRPRVLSTLNTQTINELRDAVLNLVWCLRNSLAFGRRSVPAGRVAPPSSRADILGRLALPAGRIGALGATSYFGDATLAHDATVRVAILTGVGGKGR